MSLKRRVFTREFKRGVCKQIELEQKTQAQVCREYSLGANLVSRWIREFHENPKDCFSKSQSEYPELTNDKEKIEQLERALGRVTLENQILKQATDILQKKVRSRNTTK